LAILIAAGIAVAPTGVSRKVGLALSFLAAYQALHYLSGRDKSRSATQSATGHNDSASAGPGAVASPGGAGLSAHVNEEAIYPRIYVDRNGNVLDGNAHYQIAGDMDMKAVWWSVTIYNEEFDLIPHKEERHSFTSFNTVPTDDGRRFVIDIAPERPPGAVNWLPCRRGETFNLVWRFYLPGARILDDREGFEIPKIINVAD
jgi:hypothetical protein